MGTRAKKASRDRFQIDFPQEGGLTRQKTSLKYPNSGAFSPPGRGVHSPDMNLNQQSPASRGSFQKASMEKQCHHTRVQVVSREEDAEFVECLECGDIFESSEFKDMAIEDNTSPSEP